MSGRDRKSLPNTGKSGALRQFIYSLIGIICLKNIIVWELSKLTL